jgi:hypothetical protein
VQKERHRLFQRLTNALLPADLGAQTLGRTLPVLVGGVALLMLATWIPHYLIWPWWSDLDAYASIAQGWDAGIRPYRDVVIFNFPGQIYLFWLLGKAFGWGHTVPIYAADAALVVSLGVALWGWSRRLFGRPLPGLVGFVAFLAYYLSLDYRLVAQRDSQGPLLAVLGLLVAQALRGRGGVWLSALAFAIGATIRPHVVVFLPALGLALDAVARAPGESYGKTIRVIIEWSAAFALCLALLFAPLMLQGLVGDLVRGVANARYGGQYVKTSFTEAGLVLWRQFADRRILIVPGCIFALALYNRSPTRRCAITWLLTLLLAIIYKPLHPVPHNYLNHPLYIVWSINVAVLIALILEAPGVWWVQAGAIVAVVVMSVPGVPKYCRGRGSLKAIGSLATGVVPEKAPPGAEGLYRPDRTYSAYSWGEERGVHAYLRTHTRPDTRVAVVLRNPPFLAINGPVGRISPFPAESGILWLWQVNPKLEPAFVKSLQETPDSVVVWVSNERSFDPKLQLPDLARTIQELYVFEARLGRIEVWRRRPGSAVHRVQS